MGAIVSQITSLTIVYSTVYSEADQGKYQSTALLAFVWGIHRRPVNSPHKWPVTRKMFPFDDVIMHWKYSYILVLVSLVISACISPYKPDFSFTMADEIQCNLAALQGLTKRPQGQFPGKFHKSPFIGLNELNLVYFSQVGHRIKCYFCVTRDRTGGLFLVPCLLYRKYVTYKNNAFDPPCFESLELCETYLV